MTARSHTRSRERRKRFRANSRRIGRERHEFVEVTFQQLARMLVDEGKASRAILGPQIPTHHRKQGDDA